MGRRRREVAGWREGGGAGGKLGRAPHSTYVLLVRFPRGPFPISSSRAGGEDVSSPPPPTIATCLRTVEYSAVSVFLLLGGWMDRSPYLSLSRAKKKKGRETPTGGAQPNRDLTLSGHIHVQKADLPNPRTASHSTRHDWPSFHPATVQ